MTTIKYVDLDGLSHFKAKTDLLYQAQETGKGLSTNDYTDAEKTKLTGIETGAEVNVIESVVVNGTTATISNKTASVTISAGSIDTISVNGTNVPADQNKNVDITVPTNTNQLTNGAGFITGITSTDVTTALGFTPYNSTNPSGYQTASDVSTAINTAIAGITGIDYQIVQVLPATGEKGVIYLISNSGTSPNVYDEYIWVNNAFEKIGTTAVDLSGYVQYTDLVAYTNSEIDTIFA